MARAVPHRTRLGSGAEIGACAGTLTGARIIGARGGTCCTMGIGVMIGIVTWSCVVSLIGAASVSGAGTPPAVLKDEASSVCLKTLPHVVVPEAWLEGRGLRCCHGNEVSHGLKGVQGGWQFPLLNDVVQEVQRHRTQRSPLQGQSRRCWLQSL